MTTITKIQPHTCNLQKAADSDSGLPKPKPGSNIIILFQRNLRKLCVASFWNGNARMYYKSQAALMAERRRHIRSRYWYIVHPLSAFTVIREGVMLFLWSIFLTAEPLVVTFFPLSINVFIVLDFIFILDIVCNFFIGYIDEKTQQMIINPKMIAIRYLKTFFIVDILGNFMLPACGIMTTTDRSNPLSLAIACGPSAAIQCVFKLFRLLTVRSYLQRLTDFFELKYNTYKIVCIAVTTFFVVHYFTAWLYQLSTYLTFIGHQHTLHYLANLGLSMPFTKNYGITFLQSCSLFFNAGYGQNPAITMYEQCLHIFIIICGLLYFSYQVVVIYEMVSVAAVVGNKFEDVSHQLQEFLAQKGVPPALKKRIMYYFNYRFERRFFKEHFILDTLSEHLRHEITLFNCTPLLEKTSFFKRLSKSLTGTIIAHLTRRVFSCNDVLIKAGDSGDTMYFLSTGTVAVYSRDGYELMHLEDGTYFGELSFILRKSRRYSYVCIEVTEVYLLMYQDFRRCMRNYPQYISSMESEAITRMGELKELYDQYKACTEPSEIKDSIEYM